MSDVTNASLVQQLRGRARDIGEPMEFAVIHPATCALIADRLEAAEAEIARLRAERDALIGYRIARTPDGRFRVWGLNGLSGDREHQTEAGAIDDIRVSAGLHLAP